MSPCSQGITLSKMEVKMKKEYRFSIECDDEIDGLPDEEGIWLETGECTIRLPIEIAEYIDKEGILGIA
jgi:hypothetical protein